MKKKCKLIIFCLVILSLLACLISCGISNKNDNKNSPIELSEDMVIISRSYSYTGNPITVDEGNFRLNVNGRMISMSDLIITYENNIEIGQATMIITAKSDNKYVKGTVRVHFNIKANDQQKPISNKNELISYINEGHYSNLWPNFDFEISENETLTLENGISINLYKKNIDDLEQKQGVTLINNGTININKESHISMGGSREFKVILINRGTINISGKLNINANAYLYNSGTINYEANSINNYGFLYTNTPIDETLSGGGIVYNRTKIEPESIKIVNPDNGESVYKEEGRIRYNANLEKNKPYVYINDKIFTSALYENNDKVGEATIKLETDEFDTFYFGSYTTTYNIYKGRIEIRDYESEFEEAKASNNYNEYIINDTKTNFKDILINEDEKLIIINTANVTSLTNNGIISIEPTSNAYFAINGVFTNLGVFSTNNNVSIHGGGTFNNGLIDNNKAISDINYITISQMNIYGSINTQYMSIGTQLINNGSINTQTLYINGECINNGDIVVNQLFIGAKNDGENSSYIDNVTSSLIINEASAIRGNLFSISGKCLNESNLAVAENTEFVITGEFTNRGLVYGYSKPDKLLGEFVLRKNLNDESVIKELEYYSIDYDERPHKPLLTVDGNTISLDYSKTITYLYDLETTPKQDNTFTKVGKIYVTINITDEYYPYYGSFRLSYTINHATGYAYTSSNLNTLINNDNYNVIKLTGDIELNASKTINEERTLDTNGFSLIISDYGGLTIKGKLLIKEVENKEGLEKVGLLIKKENTNSTAPFIKNQGTIQNDGIMYIDSTASYTSNNGTLINDGLIYTHLNSRIYKDSGDGDIYCRRTFTSGGAYEINLEYEETTYDGTEKEPTITILKNSISMDLSKYDISYINNINAGNAYLKISAIDIFDTDFYGSFNHGFIIKKATKDITSEVYYNYQQGINFFDTTNYDRYIQKTTFDTTCRVPDNATLVLDLVNYSNSTKIYLDEGAKIEVIVDTFNELNNYIYGANKIIFGANIGTKEDVLSLTYNKNTNSSQYIGGGNIYTTNIDFNGYSFGGRIEIENAQSNNDISVSLYSSSETKSTIGYERKYALKQNLPGTPPSVRTTINLDNLTIYGANLLGGSNGYLDVNATDCDFVQVIAQNEYGQESISSNPQCFALEWGKSRKNGDPTDKANAIFTNCTFTSFYSSVQIYGGNSTFNNCSFVSTSDDYYEKASHAGNCISICQAHNSNMHKTNVTINGGTISANPSGYSIEFYLGDNISTATKYTTITTSAIILSGKNPLGIK